MFNKVLPSFFDILIGLKNIFESVIYGSKLRKRLKFVNRFAVENNKKDILFTISKQCFEELVEMVIEEIDFL